MHTNEQLVGLKTVLNDIIATLHTEQEDNWICGFESMRQDVNAALSGKLSADTAIWHVRDTFNSMHGGNGSFSDFCIWRDDYNERMALNQKFDGLLDNLRGYSNI